jgi:LuxR family transcriptional regulator, maltose regulon positive regulatory protein
MSGLLATKLHLPSPPSSRVHRPRLIQRLNAGLDAACKVTLVSAPAGFGKSSCVAAWLKSLTSQPAAWLSLDPADEDPAIFFSYLVAALQTVSPDLCPETAALLRTGQLPSEQVLGAALAGDLSACLPRTLLVLDDFHLIQSAFILHVMETLVANFPPSFHLVLVTREDPALPLARLRAHNQLTEIRAEDLRFTQAEAASFLNDVMGLCLAEPDISVLEDRTEGWIVGLQLAGLSIRDRADPSAYISSLSGSHRFILSYLTEEVLSRLPQDTLTFLLQTSILDKLTGDLCDALTGRTDSAALLERLLAANLFLIPLDDEQRWYRCHHLFGDLLAARLKQTVSPAAIHALHCRASDWLAANACPDEAIHHALLGLDYERAGSLVAGTARAMIFSGRIHVLRGWLDALPEKSFEAYLPLKIYRSWMDLLQGRLDLTEPALLKMDTMLRALPPSPENETLRREMIVILSRLVALAGNTARAIQTCHEALAFLPEADQVSRARIYSALAIACGAQGDVPGADVAYHECLRLALATANFSLAAHTFMLRGMWLGYYGKLHEAAAAYQAIIDLGPQSGQKVFYPTGQGLIGLASLYLEWNDLEAAGTALGQGLQLCLQAGLDGYFSGAILVSRLHQAQGDLPAALRDLQALEKAAPRSDTITLTIRQIQLRLALGDTSGAAQLADPLTGLLAGGPPIVVIEMTELILARVYLAQAEIEKAFDLLDRLQASAAPAGRSGHLLEMYLLRSLAMRIKSGEETTQAAVHSLAQALALGEPEGYFLLFLEAGPDLRPLLEGVLADPSTAQPIQRYARRLLDALPGSPHQPALSPAASAPPSASLIEPLTQRELQVLRLIGEGLKYGEIGARLFISLNTVRTYVKSIYAKLAVNNRTHAIAAAHRHGLI